MMPQEYNLRTLPDMLCLDCLAGSTAQGLATETSDVDRKGVFLAPLPDVLAGRAASYITDEKHDLYYEEIGTFCRQLLANTPASLEVLYSMGTEAELSCAPWFRAFFEGRQLLSKRCCGSYVCNAEAQLKRVRAVHEKAVQGPPPRRSREDFSYVLGERSCEPLLPWLQQHAPGARYTLRPLSGTKGLFALVLPDGSLHHVCTDDEAYHRANLRAAQYEEWARHRNSARLAASGAEQYDTKHMAHVFRLLHCAAEIAQEGTLHVRRSADVPFLLAVRRGEYRLAELLERAEEEVARVRALFAASSLPDTPAAEEERLPRDLAELRLSLYTHRP